MAIELIEQIWNFLKLTVTTDALWTVIPLAISTFIIMIYFGIYREERSGWNDHLSNSLVLVFVSIALFRSIYLFEDGGAFNFVNFWGKTISVAMLLLIGMLLTRFNFAHVLPKKINRYLNSPLTINIIAYMVILSIYSTVKLTFAGFISLIIIAAVIFGLMILVRLPTKKLAVYMKREKKKDRLMDIKEAKHQIRELKEELRYRDKELKKFKFKELEDQKKEVIKLEKVIKKR